MWLGQHFQGQKVKGQGHQAALLSAALTRKAAAAVSVGKFCYVAFAWRRARRLGAHGGRRAGHIVSPHAQLVKYGFLIVLYSNFVPKWHRFWDIRLRIMSWHWNPGQRSLNVIGTDTDWSATNDFVLTFYSRHLPILHRFRDKRRFRSKIANFPTPVYFAPRWRGSAWNWVSAQRVKNTRVMGLPGRQRSLTISSAVWIEYTNVTDGQIDRQTDRHATTAKTALTHNVAQVKNCVQWAKYCCIIGWSRTLNDCTIRRSELFFEETFVKLVKSVWSYDIEFGLIFNIR